MFDAQYLPQGSIVYGPWFPRQGDSVTCTLDMVAISGAITLTVELFTKNTEDQGDGENADPSSPTTAITASATGRASATWIGTDSEGPKELVRYKFSSTGSGGWFLFRMLDPVWFDDVKAD